MESNAKSCFFTGHRNFEFTSQNIGIISEEQQKLIDEGVTDFYAGGAPGFDLVCEELILLARMAFPQIKLHIVLPCPPELYIKGRGVTDSVKRRCFRIYKYADSVEVVSDSLSKDCMKKRNARLAELGDICICYYNEKRLRSGTSQTVRMAEKLGKRIINLRVSE